MVCWEEQACQRELPQVQAADNSGQDGCRYGGSTNSRRYQRALSGQQPLPDLIIIDGGKGQLNAALVFWKN